MCNSAFIWAMFEIIVFCISIISMLLIVCHLPFSSFELCLEVVNLPAVVNAELARFLVLLVTHYAVGVFQRLIVRRCEELLQAPDLCLDLFSGPRCLFAHVLGLLSIVL